MSIARWGRAGAEGWRMHVSVTVNDHLEASGDRLVGLRRCRSCGSVQSHPRLGCLSRPSPKTLQTPDPLHRYTYLHGEDIYWMQSLFIKPDPLHGHAFLY